ncbi:uncharacterized protein LOC121348575 [Pyrgilauda ruficollis]|uniref:uncharacterized protein LOC121348575 n=1 Tax=Pyrgilauda ruficollis TaxID=221976 RepID=UPI001B883712|nr:uncharacterized protein LOC121348575 [Pyrgilauda ruficollis]
MFQTGRGSREELGLPPFWLLQPGHPESTAGTRCQGMAAPSALTLAPWCHGGSSAPELTQKVAVDSQGWFCEVLELVSCRVNLPMTLRVKDCTDVTGSPGLSSVCADKLDAKNNLPSPTGTHIWERMRKEGWGAGMPICPWEQGLYCVVITGQRSAALTAPGALTSRVAPSPLLVTAGAVWLLPTGWRAGRATWAAWNAQGASATRSHRAARTSPLSLGQFSPRCSSPGAGVGTGHRGMGRVAARVPPPATADTNAPRHMERGAAAQCSKPAGLRTPCSAERCRHRGGNPVGCLRGQGDAHPLCGVRMCGHRAMAARTMTGTSPLNP